MGLLNTNGKLNEFIEVKRDVSNGVLIIDEWIPDDVSSSKWCWISPRGYQSYSLLAATKTAIQNIGMPKSIEEIVSDCKKYFRC